MDFSRKHFLYAQSRARRLKALDLYEGGLRVEANRDYLTRHPFETEKQYEIRLERAAYRNFAAPIVDVFASFVSCGRPARTLPEELTPMLSDIDRRNGSADVFFSETARLAAAGGPRRFALVDMEPTRGLTLAENESAGRRELPYFTAIDADDVYDWGYDARGLAWVVVHSAESEAARPFETPLMRDVLTVWTRREWIRYSGAPREAGIAPGDLGAMSGMREEARGEHPLGEVPLAPFLFEPASPMTGNPATDDVLSLILRVYRRDSELDKMLFDCAVPLAIINGLDKGLMDDFIRASSNVLLSDSTNGISGNYMEPGGQSYASLRESIQADVASIREIALRMVRPQSGVGESAESKSIDKQQLDAQLASFARRCATAEAKCWELAFKWLNNGRAPKAGAISTPWNEDYNIRDAEKLDRSYLLEMLRAGAISKETYLELLLDVGGLPADFDPAAEAARLELETKAGAGPAGVDEAAKRLQDALR